MATVKVAATVKVEGATVKVAATVQVACAGYVPSGHFNVPSRQALGIVRVRPTTLRVCSSMVVECIRLACDLKIHQNGL